MRTSSVWIAALLCAGSACAHPLAEKAKAVQEQAERLGQRMTSTGQTLSWGQQMAAQDMQRLSEAAAAAVQALEPDDVDWDETRPVLSELQVAGSRVRMTLSVSNLDEEARQISQQMVSQVEEIEKEARGERDQQFSRAVSSARPAPVQFGVGFGNYWGFGPWMPIFRPARWGRCR